MLRIGEFAALTGVSINMLRNYDKIGLLIPEYVDEDNCYRYYSEAQIINANRIQILKELGFSLKEIPTVINCSNDDIITIIENKILEKQKEKIHIEEQIQRMEQAISSIGGEKDIIFSVRLSTLMLNKVVSLRENIESFEEEGILWRRLEEQCLKNNVKLKANEYTYAITHNVDLLNKVIDTEVIHVVNEAPTNLGQLKYKEVPPIETVVVSVKGAYSRIGDVSSYVHKFIEGMGYEICYGPLRKYFISPNNKCNPEEFITEYYYPIKKA